MTSMIGSKGMGLGGSGVSGAGLGGNKVPKGYKQGQLQQFTPEQMQLFQQMFSHVGPESFLSQIAGGDEGAFEQAEAPAHRMFQGQMGQLASRFSGMGTGGRKGSGFQNMATSAASNFTQDLMARRQDMQRQAIQDLRGLSSELLGQRPYEQFLTPKKKSFLEEFALGMAPGFGEGIGKSVGSAFEGKSLFGGS